MLDQKTLEILCCTMAGITTLLGLGVSVTGFVMKGKEGVLYSIFGGVIILFGGIQMYRIITGS